MINRFILDYLLKAFLIALLVLVLYGSVPNLAMLLILFVAWRFSSLAVEALRQPVHVNYWNNMLERLTGLNSTLTPQQRASRAAALKLDPNLSDRELAQAQVGQALRKYRPPRPKRELAAEALGVVAFGILIPLDAALYTSDIFSLRDSQHWGWAGALVAALSVSLYAWPFRGFKSPDVSDFRIWWWILPFVLGFLALTHAVHTRHPYLNPFNPDRHRLAAERVLSLKNNITAGAYADWVLRYARELDQHEKSQEAIPYYRAGLRLDSNDRAAADRLARLETQSGNTVVEDHTAPSPSPSAPYWTAAKPVVKQPRHSIDAGLENVENCTVVVVPVGIVPDDILDAVGYVIHNELNLPVCISPEAVPLPDYTRKRGLAAPPQWDIPSLVSAFTNATKSFPRAPVKYLILTPVDIYMPEANYVFSSSANWGAVLSFARYGGADASDEQLRQRTAKQALCALLKSFGVPPSTDREDVTSYTRDLVEFDAKGNRPDAESMKLFQQAVAAINLQWQNYRNKTRPRTDHP